MANNNDQLPKETFDQDIDQFLFGSDDVNSYSLISNGKNRLEAKKKIARLIHQDVAEAQGAKSVQAKKSTAISTVTLSQTKNSSKYLADLRPQNNTVRRKWSQLEQPKRKAGIFVWPKYQQNRPRAKQASNIKLGGLDVTSLQPQLSSSRNVVVKSSEKVLSETKEAFQVHYLKASFVFAVVFLILVVPVKTLWLAENVSRTQVNILAQGKQAIANLQGGLNAINAQDYSDAKAKFLLAEADFTGIKDQVQTYNATVLSLVEALPSLGPKVAFANQLIEVGQSLSQAAAILSATASGEESITVSLDSLAERVKNVSIVLNKASKTLELITVTDLPEEYQGRVSEIKRTLPSFVQQLQRAEGIFHVSNTLLGGQKLSRVLFVFQNNREIRATGGFAGSFAVADFEAGKMTKFDLPGGGTYDVTAGLKTTIVPPYALQLLGNSWNMWDANWWPDFPTSAKKMAWFYQKSGGTTVDAVVAINSDVLQQLLTEIGPIDLPEYGVTVNSANVYEVLQQEVQVDYDKTLNQPKKVLTDLAPIIIEKVLAYPKKLKIGELLLKAIDQKDIQFYSNDPESTEQLDNLGWSGKIASNPGGDYLQVVSTNLGGGKSDAYIQRHVDHRADIQANGDIIVTTTLTKTNDAPASDVLGYLNNVDFLRFYVPQGSTLLSASGFRAPDSSLFSQIDSTFTVDQDLKGISGDSTIDDASGVRISQEFDKTVFAHWMQVKPGATASVSITYRLPQKIYLSTNSGSLFINYWSPEYQDVDSYSLLLERQSGIHNMTFDSSVVLDPSLITVWHDALHPESLAVNQRVINYAGSLTTKDFFSILVAHQ